MGTDMTRNYSLATDDEDYVPPWERDGFAEKDDWLEWREEEEDYYDFPEDDGEGFFDPEESK
jgi:hypothetical protein